LTVPSFDAYLASLSPVDTAVLGTEPEALGLCTRATTALLAARPLNRDTLAKVVAADPHVVPVIAAAAGLSQERLRTWLQAHFDTSGWVKLGRERSGDLVAALDEDLNIVTVLDAQASREWTWADVLARVMASRQRASSSIEQGRALEDAVQDVIEHLSLPFVPRTRFEGTGGDDGPADFAIPGAAAEALIAIGVKGYDSTGSKLGDAATEIETMAKVRKPTQFIFAIVDGQGWRRRQGDLRRIYALWVENRIDGVYNLATLDPFREALKRAARRLDLLA
jgi:hypothetical protein